MALAPVDPVPCFRHARSRYSKRAFYLCSWALSAERKPFHWKKSPCFAASHRGNIAPEPRLIILPCLQTCHPGIGDLDCFLASMSRGMVIHAKTSPILGSNFTKSISRHSHVRNILLIIRIADAQRRRYSFKESDVNFVGKQSMESGV